MIRNSFLANVVADLDPLAQDLIPLPDGGVRPQHLEEVSLVLDDDIAAAGRVVIAVGGAFGKNSRLDEGLLPVKGKLVRASNPGDRWIIRKNFVPICRRLLDNLCDIQKLIAIVTN